MITFICLFSRYFGELVGRNGEMISICRKLQKLLECTHTLSNVNTFVGYDDDVDESCGARWLLVKFAQRTGDQNNWYP